MTTLPFARPVAVPEAERPQLFVVVDTEEEFDWNAPPSRANNKVTAMRHIGRAQRIFDRFGITPTYVIDYPVASQPAGYEPLREIWSRGGCVVGAHLHPWVTPPDSEEVNSRNMFMMNLPGDTQQRKLERLTEAITTAFEKPTVFKAGRYGLDHAGVGILERLGYLVDNSVCPRMDFTDLAGPSFEAFDASPFMLTDRLMEIPCTVDYVGWTGMHGHALHRAASRKAWQRFRAVGILARSGAVNRVMLSPEGNTFAEMASLAKALVERGSRVLTLTFHSPSVDVGHTPYVRTQRDLDEFLARLEQFCEYFLKDLGGMPESHPHFYQRTTTGTELTS